MTHFNLNRMLQGCSAFIQTMAGDRAARNGAKRVNNHVLPLTCPLQLRRVALILCVLVLSVGQMWGAETVLFSSFANTTASNYFKSYTVDGKTVTVAASSTTISSSSGDSFCAMMQGTPTGNNDKYVELTVTGATIKTVSVLITGNGENKTCQPALLGWEGAIASNTTADYVLVPASQVISNKGVANAKWHQFDVHGNDLTRVRIYRAVKGVNVAGESTSGTTYGNAQSLQFYGIRVELESGGSGGGAYPEGYIYITDVKATPETGASGVTATGGNYDNSLDGSFSHDGYTKWFQTSGASGYYQLNFSPALDVSSYTDLKVDLWWGVNVGSNRATTVYVNGTSVGTMQVDSKTRYQVLELSDLAVTATSISSIKIEGGGGGANSVFFRVGIKGTPAASTCTDKYSFHYGPASGDWETPICFEQVGSTHEWNITNFAIPDHTNGQFWVGHHGETNSQSQTKAWTDSYSDGNGAMKLLPVGSSIVGQATGAVGTINIWDDSGWKNQNVGFTPNGYGITYGGSGHAFHTTATAHMLETDVVTLPDVSTTYTMGLATATPGTYVTCAHSSAAEAISAMGVTNVGGGKKAIYLVPGSFNVLGTEKYAIYDKTADAFSSDFMKDDDGDGIYVGYVSSGCTSIILVRMSADATTSELASKDWTHKWNQTKGSGIAISGDLAKKFTITSLDEDNCNYSTANMQPITGQKGKFRMWDDSGSSNWYVHWIPYYVLSYDANGGTGSTVPTERSSESSTLTVSVAANGFTAPTGYQFYGWNPNKSQADAETKDDSYDPSDNVTLSADVTLYAVWKPILVTEISVDPSSKTLDVGGTVTLSATATPSTALDKTVTWSSDNTGVATVNESGVVTAVAPGSCTITATANDGSLVTGTCSITVNKITPTKYDFSVDKTTLCGGETATLTLEDSEDGVTYELREDSSHPIAETQKTGTGFALTWTGLGAGDYVVYAVADATYTERQMDGSKITISNGTATSITTQPTNQEVTVGEEATLTVVAAGTSLSYQWKESATEGGTYTNVASVGTGSSYSVTPAVAGTKWYKCEVTGTCGTVTTEARKIVATAAETHTVTYNYNGATSGASPESATGASVTLPEPTKAGYELDGWYTTAGEKIEAGGETYNPTADITLYARWTETCSGGGGGGGSSTTTWEGTPSSYTDGSFTVDDKLIVEADPNDASKTAIGSARISSNPSNINKTCITINSNDKYVTGHLSDGSEITSLTIGASTNQDNTSGTYVVLFSPNSSFSSGISVQTYTAPAIGAVYDEDVLIHEFTPASGTKYFRIYRKINQGVVVGDYTSPSGGIGSGQTIRVFQISVTADGGGGDPAECFGVYYHGNGAESGYIYDPNVYDDGDDPEVLGNMTGTNGVAFVKDEYTFQGWATSAGGSVAYSAGDEIENIDDDVDLYAVWRVENIALVTYTLNVGSSAGTTLKSSVDSGDDTNVPESNIDIDTSKSGISGSGANGGGSTTSEARSAAMSIKTGANGADWSGEPTNYVVFKYKVACGKKLIPSKVSMKVSNKGGSSKDNIKYKAVMSDGYGHTLTGTYVVGSQDGTVEEFAITNTNPDVYFQGNVTLKLWAWTIAEKSEGGEGFRMGTPVQIFGVIDDQATPPATITWTKQPAGGLSGTNETVTAVSSDGSAVTISSNNTSVATVAMAAGVTTVSYVGVGSTYLTASGTDACGNTMVSVNSDNFTVIGAYNLSYDANTGTGTMTGETGVHYAVVAENNFTAPSGKVFFGWNTAADGSGDSYQPGDAIELSANTTLYAQWGTELTATWSVTKVDSKLYRGGGGYNVTVYLNQADWDESGNKDDLDLSATEGVTLKNIVKSINGESKAQVTADFDITTALAADATAITFTLDVPAAGAYGSAELTDDEVLDECSGGSGSTISIFDGTTATEKTDVDGTSYKEGVEHTDPQTGFKYTCKGVKKDLYTSSMSNSTGNGKTYSAGLRMGGNSSSSDNYIQLKVPTGYTANLYIVSGGGGGGSTLGVSKTAGTSTSYHEYANRTISSSGSYYLDEVTNLAAGTYYILGSSDKLVFGEITVTLTPAAGEGGVTTTLSWTPALESDAAWNSTESRLDKETGDADFTFTASTTSNTLGTITYSSSNTSVATVNADGKVHIVGAEGDATITATLAASGCFDKATATYEIHVVDNCIDVPGTITSRDLGCDGTELTVSGHTATASVSYQWYKDGESLGDSYTNPTCTVTVAGEYYVVVDNSAAEGDHCAMASTNTIKVTAKAAATATKIVDSWYVKNGRRTPDVTLVKTTNATGFTVTNGSSVVIWNSDSTVTTGFGGCGFHMDDNGIIYLNGTTDAGAATSGLTGDEDETLTITVSGCGGDPVELNITIHKQASTTRPSIAFVVDGTKGSGFSAASVDHSTNSPLYEFLDYTAGGGGFDLTACNIYSTTDEKAIRQEYSKYDAILITDDPSTNTVPTGVSGKEAYKTKGYVNAFGTMVDVRPILTMEAYVSALANWKTKGIAGNPLSPNPRQYTLRLECKDHEIYKAGLPDPAPGTNVWDEVIGGETYRNVVLVDHTKSPYTGLADDEETAGKESPALQGFDGTASGSLLGLGRISNGSLQAAIERQEEPAARLLVFSIQAKALPNALTNEGKQIIKNILTYLLKTNMEEVDDCSNYFVGGASGDVENWFNTNNWYKKGTLPTAETKVRILAPCTVTSGTGEIAYAAQVDIATGGKSAILDGEAATGSLTIAADGALIVKGKIRTAEAPRFAANDLKPTTVNDLIINTSNTAQAALIFNNDDASTQATVNYYSLGRKIDGNYQYQYFAVPMEYVSVSPAFANENHGGTKIYTYVYHEGTGWERRGYYTDLYAFEGLGITTNSTSDHMNYTMTGTLASTATHEISLLNSGDGYNLVGNSWMAPIQISALAEDNTDANITKTAYIYCTGHDGGTGVIADTDGKEQAGQWIPVPFSASGESAWRDAGKLSVIPAMQSFQIYTAAEATLKLDYSKVVRGSTNSLNEKMRAPRRTASREGTAMSIIRVSDSKTYTDICLIEGEQFSEAFDNGWEAEYMEGDGRSAQFYAMNGEDKMAVMATDELEGTPVCFAPGKESNYTISFFGGDGHYYLNDLKEEKSTLIEQGNTYSFIYEAGDMPHRFLISTTPFGIPSVTTGCGGVEAQEKVQKVIYNDHVYIIRGGQIYDVMGKMMK